ncbi:MAG: hypothetical protein AAF558_06005 [Verrucomicrobiota bacterium]
MFKKLLFVLISAASWLQTGYPANFVLDANKGGYNGDGKKPGINANFIMDKNLSTSALQDIGVKRLRYPMGEIADYYYFNKNNPNKPEVSIRDSGLWFAGFFNTSNWQWKNPLTFDSFMNKCQAIGATPVVVIGIDSIRYTGSAAKKSKAQLIQMAKDWVQYAKDNNYNIKYWEIGNECDLNNIIIGTWPANQYADVVKEFHDAMTSVDPTIQVGANGQSSQAWWDTLNTRANGKYDFLVTHQYSFVGNFGAWEQNKPGDYYDFNVREARSAMNRHKGPYNIQITEASSHSPGHSHWNNVWKGLHNVEVFLNINRHHQIRGVDFWITRWFGDQLSTDSAAFGSSYEPRAMGLGIKALKFIQQRVDGPKRSGKINAWITSNNVRNKTCVYLMNKEDSSSTSVTVTVNNHSGTWNYERWELKGSSPGTTAMTWNQTGNISRSGNQFTTTLPPLSVVAVYFR